MLGTVACSGDKGRPVAEVDGIAIYTAELTNTVKQQRRKFDDVLVSTPSGSGELSRLALDHLIQERLLLNEAQRRDITVQPAAFNDELIAHFGTDDRSTIADTLRSHAIEPSHWFRTQRNKLIIKQLIDQEVVEQIPVTEQEIKRYYAERRHDFKRPRQYRARQILVDSKERADEIAKRLDDGEDFAELARTYSLSPDAERGGDLGFFSTKEFPPAFAEICARLNPGETSGVKKTDYGYQLFKLIDTRPARTLPLDAVRGEIIDILRADRSADAFAEWFEGIRTRADIIIYEDALEEVNPNARATS